MSTVHAVVVGSLVQDLSFRVPRRPEPGEVIIADAYGAYRGGKGFNQAVALARLGARVAMFGAVGMDAWGDSFIAALHREGVDASGMLRLPDIHTSVAVPLVTPDGDVAFVHSPGANRGLLPEDCRDLPECDVLLLQGEILPETSLAASRIAGERGARVLLNPAPTHQLTPELLAAADILCPNEVEARALLGGDHGADTPVALAEELSTDRRTAVVTLGARGAVWSDGNNSGHVSPPRIKAVDATGAGDSFCAALALALAEEKLLPEAVRFACAAGAHAATVLGAEPGLPSRSQIEELLRREA